MFKKLLLLATLCFSPFLRAQESQPAFTPDGQLLLGKWEVVVVYGWLEFPDGRHIDQPTEMAGKIVLQFTGDGDYLFSLEGAETDQGTYRLEGKVLTIVTPDGEEVQHIEHLNPTRCVIVTSDLDPESGEILRMRMVMMRIE